MSLSSYRILAGTFAFSVLLLGGCNGSSSSDDTTEVEIVEEVEEQAPLAEGIDITMFETGAFKVEPTIVDCTTNEGVETQCYQITTYGGPENREPGPFCPRNISEENLDNVGTWFNVASIDGTDVTLADGDLVDITGNFIASLSVLYNDDNWNLYDKDTGEVRFTDTLESCDGAAQPNVEEEFRQNCIECEMAYLGDEFEVTYLIPVKPIPATAIEDRISSVGIALDGAELSGSAPAGDILSNYTIAAFDDCGGHINLHQGYHYHATTGCTDTVNTTDGHAPLLGYAVDGYPIYAMKDEDGNEAEGLDECRGQTDDIRGYHYHAASPSENRFIGCLSGQYASTDDGGDAGAGGPDFGAIAESLSTNTGANISETNLTDALVNIPPSCDDIASAAVTLDITVEQLLVDLPLPPGAECEF